MNDEAHECAERILRCIILSLPEGWERAEFMFRYDGESVMYFGTAWRGGRSAICPSPRRRDARITSTMRPCSCARPCARRMAGIPGS